MIFEEKPAAAEAGSDDDEADALLQLADDEHDHGPGACLCRAAFALHGQPPPASAGSSTSLYCGPCKPTATTDEEGSSSGDEYAPACDDECLICRSSLGTRPPGSFNDENDSDSPFRVMAGMENWEDLDEEEQASATILGWTSETWGQHTVKTQTPWDQLSEEDVEAAEALGYDQETWEDPEEFIDPEQSSGSEEVEVAGPAVVSTGTCGCVFHSSCLTRWLQGGQDPAALGPAPPATDVGQDDGSYQIFVKTLTGKTITVAITKQHTVLHIKQVVEQKEVRVHGKRASARPQPYFSSSTLNAALCAPVQGLPPHNQRLIYAGKQFEDREIAYSCGITKECTLHCVLRLGADPGQVGALKFTGNRTCPACAEHWCYATLDESGRAHPAPIVCLLPGKFPMRVGPAGPTRVLFDASRPWTAAEIREALQADHAADVSMHSRFLLLNDRPLPDDSTVPPGSVIHTCHYGKHEITQKFFVEVPAGVLPTAADSLPLTALLSSTIGELKATIQQQTMVRSDTIVLTPCTISAGADGRVITTTAAALPDHAVLNNALKFATGADPPRLKLEIASTAHLACELATVEWPLLAPDTTLLRELLPPPADGAVTVFATFRKTSTLEPAQYREHSGRLELFANSLAWAPAVEQTVRGTSIFLASLYVVTEALASKPDEAERVLGRLAAVLPFPPALAALRLLIDKRQVTELHQAALAEAIYFLTRHQLPASVPDQSVFEGSLVSLAWLLSTATEPGPAAGGGGLKFERLSLTCGLSHSRLEDPVKLTTGELVGEAFSRAAAAPHLQGGGVFQPGGRLKDAGPADIVPHMVAARALLAHPGQLEALVCSSPLPGADALVCMDVLWADIKRLVRGQPHLRVIPAQNLRNAPRPSLALDTHGHVTISVVSGHSGGGEVNLFQPLTGKTLEVRLHSTPNRLERVATADDTHRSV